MAGYYTSSDLALLGHLPLKGKAFCGKSDNGGRDGRPVPYDIEMTKEAVKPQPLIL